MERVLVTGASGPIGAALVPSLEARGARVVRLVRGPAQDAGQLSWDPLRPLAPETVSGFDVVVHLAGKGIFTRWTAARKKEIFESREQGTSHLASALAQAQVRPRVFISASAVGYYGSRGDEIMTESSGAGQGFPADICRAWEGAVHPAEAAGIRTVRLRIGLVLSPHGGALAQMLLPFRLGLGGRLGSGKQWMSWVHVDDLVGAVHHVIGTESLQGAVNMVAPHPVTNAEFTRTLAAVLHRPALLPVPAFAARLAFGEMAQELLLTGQRAVPAKLEAGGYEFRFALLRAALADLLE